MTNPLEDLRKVVEAAGPSRIIVLKAPAKTPDAVGELFSRGARLARFITSPEAVEALAWAICPDGFDWRADITENPPANEDVPRLFDPWPARIERAQDDASRVLNLLAAKALTDAE